MNLKAIFLYIFSSNIFVAVTSILTGLLTARFLGVEDRGTYYLFVQLTAIVSVVLSFGIAQSLQFHIRSKQLTTEEGLKIAIFTCLGLTVLHIAALVVFAVGLENFDQYLISSLISLALIGNLYLSAILMTYQDGVQFVSRVNICSAVLTMMSVLMFVYIGSMTVFYSLAAILVGNLVKFILCLWSLRGSLVKALACLDTIQLTTSFARYSVSALLFTAVFVFFSKADMMLAAEVLSTAELGNYSMVLAFAEGPILVGAALGTAMFAKLPSESDSVIRKTTMRVARTIAPASIVICALLYFIIKHALVLVIGSEYNLVSDMFLQATPGIVSIVLAYIFANFHAVRAEQGISSCVFFSGFLVKVLSLYLISWYFPSDWRVITWSFNLSGIFVLMAFFVTFMIYSDRLSHRAE